MSALIQEIMPGSIADEIEIKAGDRLLAINGKDIKDILDYQFYSQDDVIVLNIEKANHEIWSIEIEKDYDEELGLIFDGIIFDKMHVCRNRCIFCFVDQLPRNMRKTLYVKDDDYRYSFIYGNFITLTNLSEDDWDRITSMRLSPLYVSVHAIQGDLRAQMLHNQKASSIYQDLHRLNEAGIEVHTQIVLCPDVNDGRVLEDTIEKLAGLYPSVQSIGIVPVGLTGHREKLSPLRPFTAAEADDLISRIDQYQHSYRVQFSSGLVYLADEFYLLAGREIPSADYYDDFPQTENGIGITRLFLDDFQELQTELPDKISPRKVCLLTGESGARVMSTVAERLQRISGLNVEVLAVKNNFFGGGVSVTGLLVGEDIIKTMGNRYRGKRVIIPNVIFRDGQDTLLDDIHLDGLTKACQADIRIVDGSAESLIKAVFDD